MPRHIALDAFAEFLLAEITLQHADERLPFLIRDLIERIARLRLRLDALLDRMRRRPRIERHGAFFGRSRTGPDVPVGIEMIRRLRPHPRCETFVEPKVIPPSHRD